MNFIYEIVGDYVTTYKNQWPLWHIQPFSMLEMSHIHVLLNAKSVESEYSYLVSLIGLQWLKSFQRYAESLPGCGTYNL